MANFKSNLIIVCYFEGENESLGHLWPSGIQRIQFEMKKYEKHVLQCHSFRSHVLQNYNICVV